MSSIELVKTYFVSGGSPKTWHNRYELSDPPVGGWGIVLFIRGEKRTTVLCPYSLWAGQVSNHSGEVAAARPVEATPERIGQLLTESWAQCARLGFQRDYSVAALALTELGQAVPTFTPEAKEGDTPRRGGKPIGEGPYRSCNPKSKRAEVARFFMSDTPQSLHEAMARLELTRSGVLSHLFTLNRDHGVGYELVSDCARLLIPEGFDLFDYTEPVKAEKVEKAPRPEGAEPPKKRTSGKPVVTEALKPIQEPSKRATVARLFVDGFYRLDLACTKLELDRSAVLSHLFTINKENGLGYELSEDSAQARLIVPAGHTTFGPKLPRPSRKKADDGAAD